MLLDSIITQPLSVIAAASAVTPANLIKPFISLLSLHLGKRSDQDAERFVYPPGASAVGVDVEAGRRREERAQGHVLGRLAGVFLLLLIGMLVMSALFVVVIYTREQAVLQETTRQMNAAPHEQLENALQTVRASALNPDLLPGIAIIYVKACLLAALTLFVSTFASTSIFTLVVMVFIYFIGHIQATAREYWLTMRAQVNQPAPYKRCAARCRSTA